MYIINERSGAIVNSAFVSEFYLMGTSDSTLVSMRMQNTEKPITLERYKNQEEAMRALLQLARALEDEEISFRMPESLYYFEESIRKDARTKRKGGS